MGIEKVSGAGLTVLSRCTGFLAENLERGFLTTLGLLLRCLGGIFSAKISMISLEKKKVVVRVEDPESQGLLAELL